MPKTVLELLRNYFQAVADGLAQGKRVSEVFPNNTDRGESREALLLAFLQQHLPSRSQAFRGGFVFDREQRISSQLDVIVTSDHAMQFRELGKSFTYVEGCSAAISVKTTLTKGELEDALTNLATVPILEPAHVRLPPNLEGAGFVRELPYRILFAFEGPAPETILKNLREFYKDRPEIPLVSYPKFVVVNNALFIERTGDSPMRTNVGEVVAPYSYHATTGVKHQGAYGLMRVLQAVHQAASISGVSLVSFRGYLDAITSTVGWDD